MRTAFMLLLLAGCDVQTVYTERPASPPPPVALSEGTPVVQNWQFRNNCPVPVNVDVWTDAQAAHGRVDPSMSGFLPINCTVGENVCLSAWTTTHIWGGGPSHEANPDLCGQCEPGWLGTRILPCDGAN